MLLHSHCSYIRDGNVTGQILAVASELVSLSYSLVGGRACFMQSLVKLQN